MEDKEFSEIFKHINIEYAKDLSEEDVLINRLETDENDRPVIDYFTVKEIHENLANNLHCKVLTVFTDVFILTEDDSTISLTKEEAIELIESL